MQTRKKDYREPLPQTAKKRRAKESAQENYLESGEIHLPLYLKEHPAIKPPTTPSESDPLSLSDLFTQLTLRDSPFPLCTPHFHSPQLPVLGLATFHSTVNWPAPDKPPQFRLHPSFFDFLREPTMSQPPSQTAAAIDRSADDYRSPRYQTSLPAMVKNACVPLAKDGSNFAIWEYRVKRLVENVKGDRGYFDRSNVHLTDPVGDRVVFSMIDLSVPPEIGMKLNGSAHEAMKTIHALFFFQSRSAHITSWKEILEIKADDAGNIGQVLRKIDAKIMDLDRSGFFWTKDSILGVMYQICLGPRYLNVSVVLKARLRANPTVAVSSREVEEAIRAVNQEQAPADVLPTFGVLSVGAPQPALSSVRSPSAAVGNSPISTYAPRTLNLARGFTPQRGVYRPPMRGFSAYRARPAFLPRTSPAAANNTPSMLNQPQSRDFEHCLGCGQRGHWVRACPYYQQQSPVPNRPFRVNLVDVNGEEFVADATNAPDRVDDYPGEILASESSLTEPWDNAGEGTNTGIGGDEGTSGAHDASGNAPS